MICIIVYSHSFIFLISLVMLTWRYGQSKERTFLEGFKKDHPIKMGNSSEITVGVDEVDQFATHQYPLDRHSLDLRSISVGHSNDIIVPSQIQKIPGIGIYFTNNNEGTPIIFQRMVSRVRAMPHIGQSIIYHDIITISSCWSFDMRSYDESSLRFYLVIFLNVQTMSVPAVPSGGNLEIQSSGSLHRVTVKYVVIHVHIMTSSCFINSHHQSYLHWSSIFRCGYSENNINLIHLLMHAHEHDHQFPRLDESLITLYTLRTHATVVSRFIPKKLLCLYYTFIKKLVSTTPINHNIRVPHEELVEIGITIPLWLNDLNKLFHSLILFVLENSENFLWD